MAAAFRDRGWRVWAGVRSPEKAHLLEREEQGLRALAADVRSEDEVKAMMAEVEREAGRLDLLINNAAVLRFEPVERTSASHFEETLMTNVYGAFLCCREALPLLRRTKGMIINISSVAGTMGLPGLSAYCASKFALKGFTEAFAEEARTYGVKVVILCPGIVRGGLSRLLPAVYRPRNEREALAPEKVAAEVCRIAAAPDGLWLTSAMIRSFPGGY
jgi:NAD(P)-dependent dehydrogenase (short-subunit alcohol dehydrogenase family)